MIKDTDRVSVTCPDCGKPISEKLGWFKTKATFVHSCGAVIKIDYNAFKTHLDDAARDPKAPFIARLVSRSR